MSGPFSYGPDKNGGERDLLLRGERVMTGLSADVVRFVEIANVEIARLSRVRDAAETLAMMRCSQHTCNAPDMVAARVALTVAMDAAKVQP